MLTLSSLNFTNRLAKLDKRLNESHTEVMVLSGTLRSLKNQEMGIQSTLDEHKRESKLLEHVNEALLYLVSMTSTVYSQRIESLVTGGLQAVFTDLDFVFSIDIVKRRHNSAIQFSLQNAGINYPLMRGTGGGVLAVIGVLLRIITIILLDMKRVLFLDETLVHVSEKYVDNVSALLKKLCSDLGFHIVLVTHQKEFVSHADHHYTARIMGKGITFHQLK